METHAHDVQNITAFFDTRSDADKAIGRLEDAGIPQSAIQMVEGADPASSQTASSETASSGKNEGFMASLKEMFMGPDDHDHDRDTYAEGLRRGGFLVSVRSPSADERMVVDILEKDGSVDLNERTDAWRAEGWGGAQRSEAPVGGASGDGTIEVVEENLRVGKREVGQGKVRVRAHTVEEQVSEDVTLETERVHIERRPVDREISNAGAAFQDRTIEVQETAEEAVMEKTARVVEEIDVGTTIDHETETVSDTVRHTEVEIEDDREGALDRKV